MPLAKSEGLPENLPLVVGEVYTITAIVQTFKLKNGKGSGLIVETTEGLRRTTSQIAMKQLQDPKTTFPAKVQVAKGKSEKSGNDYIFLKSLD